MASLSWSAGVLNLSMVSSHSRSIRDALELEVKFWEQGRGWRTCERRLGSPELLPRKGPTVQRLDVLGVVHERAARRAVRDLPHLQLQQARREVRQVDGLRAAEQSGRAILLRRLAPLLLLEKVVALHHAASA